MLKAIRIGKDLDSFLNEHPEIRIQRRNNKITSIIIPYDAQNTFLYILNNELCCLEYIYKNEFIEFSGV